MSLDDGMDDRDRHGEQQVLARGLVLEAVDCLGAASLLIGEDEVCEPLSRCADRLTQVAGELLAPGEAVPARRFSRCEDAVCPDFIPLDGT